MTSSSLRRSLGVLILVAVAGGTPARADSILFYNGDNDNRTSLTNENVVPINTGSGYVLQKALVYDDFIVPVGQSWTVTSVFSNDAVSYYVAPTTATWEIRSGVSAGKGGTLVASGDTAATVTSLGYSVNGDAAEKVSATVPSVVLQAGTYFLAVAPDSAGYYGDQSYALTTSGANSVGQPGGVDGDSFYSHTYPTAVSFATTTSAFASHGRNPYGANLDFSMGVVGTSAIVVPEPSSVALVAVGLIGTLSWARRRRSTSSR